MLRRALLRSQSGQALVEMALVMPLLILLLFGVIEMGRIGYTYISVSNAARAGARVASLGSDDSAIRSAVAAAAPALSPSDLIVEIAPPEGERQSGSMVTVRVSYPVHLLIPLYQRLVPNPLTVGTELSMRLE